MPAPAPGTVADADTGWGQRGIGHGWQFRFFHFMIRTFGKRPAYHISYIVTFWYVLFNSSIRQRTRHYLDRRFPQHTTALRRFLDSYRLVRTFGTNLVDVAVCQILGPGAFRASSPDVARAKVLAASPRGFVMLHAHAGSWQVALSELRQLGKAFAGVMIPEPKSRALLEAFSIRVIDPRNGLDAIVEMMQVLRRGEVLAFMGDRTFGDAENAARVNFLGQPIWLPIAPYRLASATGTPVVVFLAPKTGFKSFEVRIAKVIEVPPRLGRDAEAYAPYAQQFADCLAEFVERYPWQFYNFYDLWAAPTASH